MLMENQGWIIEREEHNTRIRKGKICLDLAEIRRTFRIIITNEASYSSEKRMLHKDAVRLSRIEWTPKTREHLMLKNELVGLLSDPKNELEIELWKLEIRKKFHYLLDIVSADSIAYRNTIFGTIRFCVNGVSVVESSGYTIIFNRCAPQLSPSNFARFQKNRALNEVKENFDNLMGLYVFRNGLRLIDEHLDKLIQNPRTYDYFGLQWLPNL